MDRFTFETSRPNFYAGGDVITGASNVSNAMGGGKQAASNIDERLMPESTDLVRAGSSCSREFEYGSQTPP